MYMFDYSIHKFSVFEEFVQCLKDKTTVIIFEQISKSRGYIWFKVIKIN